MENIFPNKYFLPASVKHSMLRDPMLGVCIVFKDNKFKRWFSTGMPYSMYALERISNLMNNWKYSDFERDFVILDDNGDVCINNCNANVTKREDGLISVNDDYYVRVIKDKSFPQYVGGKTEEDVEKKIDTLVRSKQIKRFR
jgi:hypothetical protein